MRADIRLFEQGLAPSREKARALIMAGKVTYEGAPVAKPGTQVPEDAQLTLTQNPIPFVSRGGLKLQKALETFPLSLQGVVAADIGASTGGFTDCMLQQGATKVYAVDVGYGQLDWTLRNDPRVVVMERTNARNMQPDWFLEPLQFASVDVSFISVQFMLSALYPCMQAESSVIALIKPQFEAGRGEVGKNGVVREAGTHIAVCNAVAAGAAGMGYRLRGLTFSPITGPKGNIEFLAWLYKGIADAENMGSDAVSIPDVVMLAHQALK